ncbi:hypothetical protein [Kitasatospora sp. GP82]|uniref:hypothetical protein n=1 Tax=Kitasatospora sp. GP82 TaxID=3035089 RepID=UPI00247460CE|nr:hypothetical protein [Kitasatospora sp. GP82]MDH6123994.1 hypothetical protein [Kitasatospora sp. GP82]
MPTISVITVVPDGGHRHLPEAYRSLCDQRLPAGWEWQWVVQGAPSDALPEDARVSVSAGAGAAGDDALVRATGSLVRALDADGLLPQGALGRDIEIMTQHPELGWCLSPGLELRADETLSAGPADLPAGPLHPGVLAAVLREGHQHARMELPAPGANLTARTELVRALGSRPEPTAGADLGLLLACEAVAQGWMIEEPGVIRRAPGRPSLEEGQSAAVLGRVEALLRTGWRWQSPPTLSQFEQRLGQSPDPQWAYDRRVEIHSAVNSVLREADDLVKRRTRNGRWTPPGEISEGGSNIGLVTAARVWILDRLEARILAAREVLEKVERDTHAYRKEASAS